MKEHYVSYECAVALKRLGFDWDVHGYYYEDFQANVAEVSTPMNLKAPGMVSAPRLDQAAAWIREKGWYIEVFLNEPHSAYGVQVKEIPPYWRTYNITPKKTIKDGGTYEQALSAGIDKALELLGKEVKE